MMRILTAFVILATLGLLVGCGGGSSSSSGGGGGSSLSIALSPATPSDLSQSQTVAITASVSNDSSNKGVTWSLSGPGTLNGQTPTAVTYTAPSSLTSNSSATIIATSAADNSVSTPLVEFLIAPGQRNVVPIAVDGGVVSGQIYPDGSFASATICVPGTSNCQTVDGLLVDTGSVGLRVLQSALSIPLSPLTSGSATLNECVQFVDTSFLWGQVAPADVYLAGEAATNMSVQVVADPTGFTIPSSCNPGTGIDEDTQAALGANGILGVGPETQDCGSICASGGSPPVPAYYTCANGACNPAFVTLSQQVTNPVLLFSTDNNGDALTFPAVGPSAAGVDGSLIFGIGTLSNNGLGSSKVYTMDPNLNITTVYKNQSLTQSFIDSGSNAYFFPDATIATCTQFTAFFCPPSTLPETALNIGANNTQANVNFSVANADTEFNSNPNNAAYGDLAGPQSGLSFDWGLPFFFGKTVFTAISGQTTPAGPGPYWAY